MGLAYTRPNFILWLFCVVWFFPSLVEGVGCCLNKELSLSVCSHAMQSLQLGDSHQLGTPRYSKWWRTHLRVLLSWKQASLCPLKYGKAPALLSGSTAEHYKKSVRKEWPAFVCAPVYWYLNKTLPFPLAGTSSATGNLSTASVQRKEGEHGDPGPWSREQCQLLQSLVQRRV